MGIPKAGLVVIGPRSLSFAATTSVDRMPGPRIGISIRIDIGIDADHRANMRLPLCGDFKRQIFC